MAQRLQFVTRQKKNKMEKVATTWMKLMKNYLAKVPKVQKGPNLIK